MISARNSSWISRSPLWIKTILRYHSRLRSAGTPTLRFEARSLHAIDHLRRLGGTFWRYGVVRAPFHYLGLNILLKSTHIIWVTTQLFSYLSWIYSVPCSTSVLEWSHSTLILVPAKLLVCCSTCSFFAKAVDLTKVGRRSFIYPHLNTSVSLALSHHP